MKTAGELAKYFSEMNPNLKVMIRDGFNGGGVPREINSGPRFYTITSEDAEDTCDCEDIVEQTVIIMGFGLY